MRYFVHTAYSGSNYHGWQRQPGVSTVQEAWENCFKAVIGKAITCVGCGRTDAGVHASQYFFHFDLEEPLPGNLLFILNKVLPDSIALFDIIPVDGFPHAQFTATHRTYSYFIHFRKDPFLASLSSLYLVPNLNLMAMKHATERLISYKNFSAFCRSPQKNTSNFCEIFSANWFVSENGERLRFQISSKRFLQGMVRLIVNRLVDIGTGELSMNEFEAYLAGTAIPKKVTAAYPQGLYLSKITYPFLDLPARGSFDDTFYSTKDSCWTKL